MGQLWLVYLLYGHNFLVISILTLKYRRKLSLAKFPTSYILFIKAQVVSLLLEQFYPIKNGLLILVIQLFWLHQFVFVRYDEPVVIGALFADYLSYVEAS